MNIQNIPLLKYPRTPHLEGSRLQDGDDASDQIPLSRLAGQYVVIEEKLDGANSAISFSDAGELLLQSRGHYLVGGASERQFNLLKPWACAHEHRLLDLLEDLYVMYGEWAYSKHSVFYDLLPHFFHEFDIYDRRTGHFLSTQRRHAMLQGLPVLSVPVLYAGPMPTSAKLLWKLVFHSLAKSKLWKTSFETTIAREGLPLDLCWKQTDRSDRSEGLYLKVEDDEKVLARYKLVRHDFVQTILDSGSHHSRRPIVPNQLAPGVDLYADVPTVTWESLGLKTLRSLEELQAVTLAQLEGGRL
jgi:hypothetical protein